MKKCNYVLRCVFIIGLISAWSGTNAAPADDVVCGGCIGSSDIKVGAVTSGKIKDGAVKTVDIAGNAITSGKIKDGEVNAADVATNAITSQKIKNGEVKTADVASNAITSAKIKNGEVKTADIASGAVTTSKLSSGLLNTIEDLAAQVAAQAERLEKLEGVGLTMEDVAGSYKWTGLQIGLMESREIETNSFLGSVDLSSDGTFTVSLSETISSLSIFDGGSGPSSDTGFVSLSGTWSVSGTTVTAVFSFGLVIDFSGVSGNRLLVGLTSGDDYTKHLILLTKD